MPKSIAKRARVRPVSLPSSSRKSPGSAQLLLKARIVRRGLGPEVTVLVDGEQSPRPARTLVSVGPRDLGREVALSRFASEPGLLVMGFILSEQELDLATPLGQPLEARLDGERVVLEAARELELRCGKATLLLRADGKVLLRGEHLVSSSAGANLIRGGAVRIN